MIWPNDSALDMFHWVPRYPNLHAVMKVFPMRSSYPKIFFLAESWQIKYVGLIWPPSELVQMLSSSAQPSSQMDSPIYSLRRWQMWDPVPHSCQLPIMIAMNTNLQLQRSRRTWQFKHLKMPGVLMKEEATLSVKSKNMERR